MFKRIIAAFGLLMALSVSAGAQENYFRYLKDTEPQAFILIDKEALTLSFIDGAGHLVRKYGVACAVNYGNKTRKGDSKTPEGQFKINQILDSRHLSHDFKDGKGPVAGAYGPWFLRLDVPGFIDIGIHGTHLPESIGTRSSEGCIRMRNEDILDLKGRVRLGMPVVILPDKAEPSLAHEQESR